MSFTSSNNSRSIASFIAFLFLSLLSHSLGADRIIKSIFIDPPKDAPQKVFLVAPDQPAIEIALPSRKLSPDVEIPSGDLVFAVLPRPLSEGEKVPKGAPLVKIPEAWSRCYLLITYQKENNVFPLEIFPINGSLNVFPPGHSRIVNHTQALVRGKFGAKTIQIRPQDVKSMEPPMKKFGNYPVAIDFMMKGDKQPQKLAQTTWQHDPRSRQILLITHPAGVKHPRIRALQDRIPQENQ